MLEPQSTVLFVLLVLLFGGLIWWLVVTRRLALRIVAACLAFVMAMAFGVLAVNRYFGYYQTWGAAMADFSSSGPSSGPQISPGSLLVGDKDPTFNPNDVYMKLALQQGYTLHIKLTGKLSHLTRSVYIYLPPEYFEPQFKDYRFPVIELIHGQPGDPQDWINVVGVQVTMDKLVNSGKARPAVLVMPDANGGNNISLQCLNQAGGPQDLTFLALDVTDQISHMLRVQPPGAGWGVAGYSEGGFCAANMALHYRYRYGLAASMSGYFSPFDNKWGNPPKLISPFGSSKALRQQNTPIDEVRKVPAGAVLPEFWLGAGTGNKLDVDNAEYFAQELGLHEANVPVVLTPGGGHTMATWHAEVPGMLTWMTNGLVAAVANAAAARKSARLRDERKAKRAAEKNHHSPPARKRPAGRSSASTPAPEHAG
jgi:enterochelin esterase-like enzyme